MKNVVTNLKAKLSGPTGQSRDAISTAKNWYSDRFQTLEMQRSVLTVLLVICLALIALLAFDISYIKATRSIEPFVIEIEPKSGVATVVTPLDSKVYSEDEVIKKYFVWRYIKYREEYSFALYDYNYKLVDLYSAPEVFGPYSRSVRRGNKSSPVETLGEGGSLVVELKSITFIAEGKEGTTAQVRFRSTVNGSQNGGASDYVVIMTFAFENSKLDDKQRFDNPLGFTVKKYVREAEYSGS